jgi:hypothetical protein
MRGNIISYFDMCQMEGSSLQRGMNFRLKGRHSVVLMSIRPNSPYQDEVTEDGAVLIYEGHDVPNTVDVKNPKAIDQPEFLPGGSPSENGKFHKAAQDHKGGLKLPDVVKVYEKIKKGIWSDNGYFHLVDSWQESDGDRSVFKFKLIAVEGVASDEISVDSQATDSKRSRVIPAHVKLEVFKRDRGKCVECGSSDELHFDHILPYSKGGTSLKANNVQLLCARHNLQKSDKIQ